MLTTQAASSAIGIVLGLVFFVLEWFVVSDVRFTRERLTKSGSNLAMGLLRDCSELVNVMLLARAGEALSSRFMPYSVLSLLHLPAPLSLIVGVTFVDLAVYVQHRASHEIPFLWRFHRVHHTGDTLSPLTGFRHHPVSWIMERAIIVCIFAVLGLKDEHGIMFGMLQWPNGFFQHSHIRFPRPVERVLSLVFILPKHHRLHHLEHVSDTNTNYCFLFSFWDRLFRTFNDREAGAEARLGLEEYVDPQWQTLWGMLKTPFVKTPELASSQAAEEAPVPSDTPVPVLGRAYSSTFPPPA